ncbi:MAG: molybdopterin-synthase adenylyltransferase MoeB [Proteobacteria bacterium]|nr:molybdopterin-synthase adenylyltransferase MoeB [Pseudomonadota bacterium]MDA1332039.1 molybdopterin-synthase adenylyltransferase MoeB [Pseudomonadota bacterium]
MNDDQLLRYSRHILLPEIGVEGQDLIQRGRILIIGAGGLGSPAALFLASSGVGSITICDEDTVDLTNLQRQIIHTTASIGMRKVDSAARSMKAINPNININAITLRASGTMLEQLVSEASIVLDCSDNFETRHAVNKASVKLKKPLVSGAAIKFDGQLAVFDPRNLESPCYQCLFPEENEFEETRCAVMGVFAPLVGIIGTAQASEALKLLANIGRPATGKLMLFDALEMEWRSIKLSKDPRCSICGV